MYKLVIVDDEDEIRQALSNYIPWSEMGFEFVNSFSNGKDAYNYFKEHEIDVLLCDIKMPVMSGIELAEKIHKENLDCKIVFLSAHKEFDYARKALAYGFEDYLLKPTKYQELLAVFEKVKAKMNKKKQDEIKEENIDSENLDKYDEKIISKIKKYIEYNYKTANLEEAAAEVHFSPAYLS